MNHQEKLAYIREKCIEANPSRGWCRESADGFTEETPARLADILLTFREIGPMTHNVNALLLVGDQRLYEIQWNLRKDDLALQDKATVDFIYRILA